MFKCLKKFFPTDEVEFQNNWWYTSLQEYSEADQYKNATTKKTYRCAVSILYVYELFYILYYCIQLMEGDTRDGGSFLFLRPNIHIGFSFLRA